MGPAGMALIRCCRRQPLAPTQWLTHSLAHSLLLLLLPLLLSTTVTTATATATSNLRSLGWSPLCHRTTVLKQTLSSQVDSEIRRHDGPKLMPILYEFLCFSDLGGMLLPLWGLTHTPISLQGKSIPKSTQKP